MKYQSKLMCFYSRKCIENVVCEMPAIFSQPKCVNADKMQIIAAFCSHCWIDFSMLPGLKDHRIVLFGACLYDGYHMETDTYL